ncbi:hypothetical protein EJB05_24348, partial [Eragrostis curvula]
MPAAPDLAIYPQFHTCCAPPSSAASPSGCLARRRRGSCRRPSTSAAVPLEDDALCSASTSSATPPAHAIVDLPATPCPPSICTASAVLNATAPARHRSASRRGLLCPAPWSPLPNPVRHRLEQTAVSAGIGCLLPVQLLKCSVLQVLRGSLRILDGNMDTCLIQKNPNAVSCKRCNKLCNGGIYRLKQHISGLGTTVGKCKHATQEEIDDCTKAIEAAQEKKRSKRAHNDAVRKEVNIGDDGKGSGGSASAPVVLDDESREIHTKKRNRLDVNWLQNLVYVQFNARLLERQEKNKEKGNGIDVLLANDAVHVQDWLIEDAYGPERPVNVDDDELIDVDDDEAEATQPRRSVRVRELYEDDFKSDSDGEIDVIEEEIEYEEDDDEVGVGVDPLDDDDIQAVGRRMEEDALKSFNLFQYFNLANDSSAQACRSEGLEWPAAGAQCSTLMAVATVSCHLPLFLMLK